MIKFEILSPLKSLERAVLSAACDIHSGLYIIRNELLTLQSDVRALREERDRPWGIIQGVARIDKPRSVGEVGHCIEMPWGARAHFGSRNGDRVTFLPQVEILEFTYEFIGTPGYAISEIRVGNMSQIPGGSCASLNGRINTPVKIGNQMIFDLVKVF